MAQPYVGEIRMFAGNFGPAGWMLCQGQLLPIAENEILFQLIGTTYGGDGESTFQLPNLQSRIPIHMGNGSILAETGGAEEITLTINQIPIHNHALVGTSTNADNANAESNLVAQATTFFPYLNAPPNIAMASQSISPTGGSQPHTNLQPYLAINFIISLYGIFPSPT